MDYENYREKVLEIISNNRRFAKIKDVYENGDNIIIKTIDDLEYKMTSDEFRMLSKEGYMATEPHILYYLHDELPEGYFEMEMSEAEKLWRTLNRMRDTAEDIHNTILHYFTRVKYWINNEKREENAKNIDKELYDTGIESKMRSLLCNLQSFSSDINYPDLKPID